MVLSSDVFVKSKQNSQVGITCLFKHVASSRDSLLKPQTQSSAAFRALHSHFQWHIFAKWLLCLVSVGTRAAPLAVDSAMVMAMARRISVQRNSTPARLSTPSQTHPWDQGATPLLWLVKYCTGL